MTFANAKNLHNEDEVTIKETGVILSVISKEIKDKTATILYDDGTFKESTPEEVEKSWQDLCKRIREEYGEDAI